MLEGIDYLPLYGNEPSAIEQVYAIFANVVELDELELHEPPPLEDPT